jgi:hypothetical protein
LVENISFWPLSKLPSGAAGSPLNRQRTCILVAIAAWVENQNRKSPQTKCDPWHHECHFDPRAVLFSFRLRIITFSKPYRLTSTLGYGPSPDP